MNKKKIAKELVRFLKRRYGRGIKKIIRREEPFKLLITTILSQRTRDENTGRASKNLFSKVSTPEEILSLNEKKLEELIKPSGMYRQKAKRIKEVCKILLKKYNGKVPEAREELLKLPGVGFKTADVVLMYGFGIPSIAIDTHCNRIPKRIGLVSEKADVKEVKRTLENLIPKKDWYVVNLGLVQFGREICLPINPKCLLCPISEKCNYFSKNVAKNLDKKFAYYTRLGVNKNFWRDL
jgi:endonuclease-3